MQNGGISAEIPEIPIDKRWKTCYNKNNSENLTELKKEKAVYGNL